MLHTKKRYLLALYRLEEDMQRVLEKLEGLEAAAAEGGGGKILRPDGLRMTEKDGLRMTEKEGEPPSQSAALTAPPEGEPRRGDEWLQSGIDNILSYQAGKKKEREA